MYHLGDREYGSIFLLPRFVKACAGSQLHVPLGKITIDNNTSNFPPCLAGLYADKQLGGILKKGLAVMDNVIWTDKKRWFGKPISFTEYTLTDDKLYCSSGLLLRQTTEVLLYRIVDITLYESLIDRFFGTGTLKLKTRIDNDVFIYISHVASPSDVRDLISKKVAEAYKDNKVIRMES